MSLVTLVTMFLGACASGQEAASEALDSGGGGPTTDDSSPPLPDPCDGLDNNGDGAADEHWPDSDTDGIADCVDTDCDVSLPESGTVPLDATCVPTVDDPWSIETLWAYNAVDPWSDAVATRGLDAPIVAQLNDDDRDGEITKLDIPDVLVRTFPVSGFSVDLTMVRGSDGEQQWALEDVGSPCGMVVIDPLGLGLPDVYTLSDGEGYMTLRRLDGRTGEVRWATSIGAEIGSFWSGACPITGADLEGDGRAEVITPLSIVDAESGDALTELSPEPAFTRGDLGSSALRGVTAGDVDGDGIAEVLVGATLYSSDGTVRWRAEPGAMTWPVLVQADADPDPEVLVLGARMEVRDADGTVLVTGPDTSGSPGQPCVGDLDGDGADEVVYQDDGVLRVLHLDGTVLWDVVEGTADTIPRCSLWDLDGNGSPEVFTFTSSEVIAIEGASGAEHALAGFTSTVGGWAPGVAVADVDQDGSPELLFVRSDREGPLLTAMSHAGRAWPAAPGLWPTQDYAVDNVDDQGRSATVGGDWWATRGYRKKPMGDLPDGVDLTLSVVDSCLASCEGELPRAHVVVSVHNEGPSAAPAGVKVALYAQSGQLLEVQTIADTIPSGSSPPALDFVVNPRGWAASGLRFVVDDDGSGVGGVAECQGEDNVLLVSLAACP